jgi:diadenosine tetraphosphate (Ap4A) HIT family hydrolase
VSNLIEQRVAQARAGQSPYVIARMSSGWLVIGDVQPLPGYCLLLADPVVAGLNALAEADRVAYALDMIRIGDALMEITGAWRINYLTLANLEPSLHTHIVPRFADEPDEQRRLPPFQAYDWSGARPFDPVADKPFMDRMRRWLAAAGSGPES